GERRNIAKGSYKLSFIAGEMRMGAIFYNPQIMLSCDGDDRAHVRRLPVEVNGNDANGGRRDFSFDISGINGEGFLVRVTIHDSSPSLRDGLRCRDPGMCRGDDFVAAFQAEPSQGDVDCVGTVRARDATSHAKRSGPCLLEGVHVRSANVG